MPVMNRTSTSRSRGLFPSLLLFVIAVTLQSTYAGRIRGDDLSSGRHLELVAFDDLDPITVMVENDRDDTGEFPGEILVLESDKDKPRTAGWTRMKAPPPAPKVAESTSTGPYYYGKQAADKGMPEEQYASTVYGWKWKSKYKYYNTKGSCKTSAPSFSPAPSGSPSVSASPSQSMAPSGSPSVSQEPTATAQPTPISKKMSKTKAPSFSPAPSGSPSVSFVPTTSIAPSGSPSVSLNPTMTPGPTTSKSGREAKGSRCTQAPTAEPESESSGQSITDIDGADVCGIMAASEDTPKPEDADGVIVFNVNVAIESEYSVSFGNDEIIDALNDVDQGLQLGSAGCWDSFDAWLEVNRRLLISRLLVIKEDATDGVAHVDVQPWEVDSPANCGSTTSGQCTERFEVTLEASYIAELFGNSEKKEVNKNIQKALEELLDKLVMSIDNIKGYDIKYVKTNEEASTGPDAAIAQNNVARSYRSRNIIGAAAGLLTLLLLIVLLARRRRSSSDEVSHLKLDDEGDETFIREFDSTTDDSPYKSRRAHVVGEEDSIFSGWTGYTKGGGSDDGSRREGFEPHLGRAHGDVHVCSSATCEVCERRRQQGLQFIPTGAPPRPQTLPIDAEREYFADDTVDL